MTLSELLLIYSLVLNCVMWWAGSGVCKELNDERKTTARLSQRLAEIIDQCGPALYPRERREIQRLINPDKKECKLKVITGGRGV